tara:strand:+ start:51 stop:851 length:801 start_codon:yes stop_codon:yes gene_type:complete
MVKKYCDDDVCLMIVFVIVGFSLCYLFKDRISGFANFASPFGEEGDKNILQVNKDDIDISNIPLDKFNKVGIELKPRKPQPSPSTKRALEVMAQKPPVEKRMIKQKNGLLVQDAMIFKPFDEVWNPGFMPLDMVFKNVPKSQGSITGEEKPMGPDRPMGQVPMPPPSPPQPSPSGGGNVDLVLIYAPWCGHSKRMLPDYERVESEFNGKTINGKTINIMKYTDKDADKVKEYGVKGFPSLFIEKDGNRESFPHRTYDKISEYLNSI